MDNNIIHIDKPNFDLAKTKIRTSLNKVPKSVQLEKFREKGTILSFTNHNVTGSEINLNLVAPLQKMLIDQNDNIKTIFRTLDEVYKAFESLDKEYIHGILSAVKSAEMASNQAKAAGLKAEKASGQALDAVNKANKTQEDIKKTILALQKTVEILKEFKDKVTNDLSKLSSLSNQISSLQEKNKTIENRFISIKQSVISVQSASAKLNGITHLDDIDTIWSDIESHKVDLSKVHADHESFVSQVGETIARIDSDINALQAYRTRLESYPHLGDIDTIWSDVEDHKLHLSTLDKLLEDLIEEINKKTNVIKNEISEMSNAQQEKNEQFNKKIKKAYRIAGWSIALSLGHMLLQWLGVL